MIELLLLKSAPYILGVLAVVAAFFGIGSWGKSRGKQSARDEMARQNEKAMEDARHVGKKIDRMGDDDVRDAASKWVRGDKR